MHLNPNLTKAQKRVLIILGVYGLFAIILTAASNFAPSSFVGTFIGDGSGLTNVPGSNIVGGVSGILTNKGSGTNNCFTSPNLINATNDQITFTNGETLVASGNSPQSPLEFSGALYVDNGIVGGGIIATQKFIALAGADFIGNGDGLTNIPGTAILAGTFIPATPFGAGTNTLVYTNLTIVRLNGSSVNPFEVTNTGGNKFLVLSSSGDFGIVGSIVATQNVIATSQFIGNGAGITNLQYGYGLTNVSGVLTLPGIAATGKNWVTMSYTPNGSGQLTGFGGLAAPSVFGSGGGFYVQPTSTRPGALGITSTSSQYGTIGNGGEINTAPDFDCQWTVEFKQSSVSNLVWLILGTASGTPYNKNQPTNTVGFRYSNGPQQDAGWVAYTQGGAVTNQVATGIAFALNTTYVLGVNKVGSTVKQYINGTLVATSTWNPTDTSCANYMIGTILTGSATHEIDLYSFSFRTAMP